MNNRLLSSDQFKTLVIYNKKSSQSVELFERLLASLVENKVALLGNLYYNHDFLPVTDKTWQFNIAALATDSSNLLLIGFDTGHVAAIALMCNPLLKVTVISDEKLVPTCFQIVQDYFGADRLIVGISQTSSYDFLYISTNSKIPSIVNADLHRALLHAAPFAYVVMTDYQAAPQRAIWDFYIAANILLPKLNVFPMRAVNGSLPIIGVVNSTQTGDLHHAFVAMSRALAHKANNQKGLKYSTRTSDGRLISPSFNQPLSFASNNGKYL